MALLPTTPINRVQPQTAQLEMRFSAPLLTDMQVQKVEDLLRLKYNYAHKLVWVKDTKSFYYLADGNGSLASNWKRYVNSSTIDFYDPTKDYYIGELVHLEGIIYRAEKDVPVNTPPPNKEFWSVISGESISYRYIFDNVDSIQFNSTIINPIIQVFMGTFTKENGDYKLDNNGMILLNNPTLIEPDMDVNPDTNSTNYVLRFFKNGVATKLSGIINVK